MESLLVTTNFAEMENDGYFSLNQKWNITKMDSIAENIFRKNPNELIGKNIWRECPHLIGTEIETALRETMRKQTVHSVRASGIMTNSWYNFLSCPTCDGISVCCQDISFMMKAQSLLAQSQQTMSFQTHLLENVHDAICAADKESTIIYWNKYSEQLFGWTADEVAGKSMGSVFNTRFISDTRDVFTKKLFNSGSYEGEMLINCRDGADLTVHVHSKAITNSDGKVCEVIHCFHDITNQRLIEEKLKESELLYRTLFNSIDEGFCIVELINDVDGEPVDYIVRAVNPAHERITGFNHSVGKRITEIFKCVDNKLFEHLKDVFATNIPERFEYYHVDNEKYYDIYMSRVGDPTTRRIAVVFNDITERKRSEKELLESKTNALMLVEELHKEDKHKNTFIATLSHELRNPLASIMMGVSLMELSAVADENAQKACAVIKRQGQQLTRLVDDLLDVTRLTQNKIHLSLQQLELNELILRTVEDYSALFQEKGVYLNVEYAKEPITMNADAVRLMQVIGNLLSNSVKFTGKNGTTNIAITKDDPRMEAVITISDNGIGIRPEFLATMFRPFMQADTSLAHTDGGLGLGLAIVKGIVELHHGTVSVCSDGYGKGATFTLRLPVLPSKPKDIYRNITSPSQKLRILLIDDNTDLLEIMSDMMSALGYEPIAASDGITGIAKAKEYMPDVILCDIGLPMMNGYEVASHMHNDNMLRNIPMIAMTGYAQPEDKARAKEAGFQRHLAKPVDIMVLNQVLREYKK